MKRLNMFLGEGWQVKPAGGATGEAYIAEQGEQRLFLKRNSSPFLAVLSAEGIVPKLLWTKRLENGDVITAQRWVYGRELKAFEMKEPNVAHLLAKIHHSVELLDMFKRMGNDMLTPQRIIDDLKASMKRHECDDLLFQKGLKFLQTQQEAVNQEQYVVCHCDINHNNWMMSDAGELYLIDWDGATVADPALDLGLLLYSYVPRHEWKTWLANYGLEMSDHLLLRMHWYVVSQTISVMLSNMDRGKHAEAETWQDFLKTLLDDSF